MPFSRGSSQPKERTPVSCHLQWSVGYLPLAAPGKPHIFTKQKFFSALSRKDQVLRQYVLAERRQIWIGSFLRPPKRLGRAGQPFPQTATQADCHRYQATETGMGKTFTAASVRALEPCRTQPQVWPLSPQLTRWFKAGWARGPQGEGRDPSPTSLSTKATTSAAFG